MKREKLIYWIGGAVVLAILVYIAIIAFGGNSKLEVSDPLKFEPYISAYSGGVISKNGEIIVQFTESFAKKAGDKKPVDDLMELDPGINGKLTWIDDHTISFKPDKPFVSGQEYFVIVNLKAIDKDIAKEFREFVFKIKVKQQNFDVVINELITTDLENFTEQEVVGSILLADTEAEENVKKLITASVSGQAQSIVFEKTDDLKYEFRVQKIKRTDKNQKLRIDLDGSAIGLNKKDYIEYSMPALGVFSVIDVQIQNFPEQQVIIQFSDPLLYEQLLEGLVSIGEDIAGSYVIRNNIIKFIPEERLNGDYDLVINEGIQNLKGKAFEGGLTKTLHFELLKPAVRLVNTGVILPENEAGLVFPFEAVNVKAVDVRITKIFENNILFFLQSNALDESYQLERVGKVVKQQTVDLSQSGITDFGKWNRFTLDLNDLIKTEPGAIYRIEINFRKKNSIYPCNQPAASEEAQEETVSEENYYDDDKYFWERYDDYSYGYDYDDYYEYYYDDYSGSEGDNGGDPCKDSYYGHKKAISRNILASNIGMTVKQGKSNTITAIVNDLISTAPVANANVSVYSYQMQVIASGTTNAQGIVEIAIPANEKPHFVVSSNGKHKAYVTLDYANSLSLSEFNVSGASGGGSKGFIFGERGVWRPGDSIYLSFILQDKDKLIPEGHPIVLEVTNPNGQQVYREVQSKNSYAYHTFRFKTDDDAITGYYYAKITVGNEVFTKSIPIETIKPNRLNIKIEFDKPYISGSGDVIATLTALWLHGAVAKDLKTTLNISLENASTSFKGYEKYNFVDFTKRFEFTTQTLFDGVTDENGKLVQPVSLSIGNQAPGMLYAKLTAKVFEKGGNFSIVEQGIDYHPYATYVGYRMPEQEDNYYIKPGSTQKLDIVILDRNGKKVSGTTNLELTLYKYNYSWWYDYENTKTNYASANYNNAIIRETVKITNGSGSATFETPDTEYGSFIVMLEDKKGGHSTSGTFYVSSYDYGYNDESSEKGVNRLDLTANKDTFAVGEDIVLNIPSVKGRALISIENGSKVLKTFWTETSNGSTQYTFKATDDMAPNVFINVSLFQPHNQTDNDHPIRMYGVIPIVVEDPATHLHPVISMPNELKSESEFNIKISEKDGRPMAYTIAVVDEGILYLTNYKTPDPWSHFYSREALGVSTWDMYDYVIGAFGVDIEKLLSIGGDASMQERLGELKANRFEPMVRFIGPFYLEKGKTATHTIKVPAYVGSVRTMVVARYENAYGSAEKSTPVTKPLMLLGTLPRVLGPQEEVVLPVSVFAMDNAVKSVNVQVRCNDLILLDGPASQTINFPKKGEQYVQFKLKAGTKTGVAKIQVTAQSGMHTAKYEMEIDVRYPISEQTDVITGIATGGKTADIKLDPRGLAGTNKLSIEVYSIPPLNLEKRLKYLIQYPHGCIEQITSAAFPQLYLSYLSDIDEKQKKAIQDHINTTLKDLSKYQHSSGGFAYWPGSYAGVSSWGTSYAGHFMLEAESMGYQVPAQVKKNWLKYQKAKASGWIDEGYSSQIDQAYRLYTLALSGNADKGSMNRMLQNKKLCKEAKWRLAAAYMIAGKKDVALQLTKGLETKVADYLEMGGTFGSALRDKAMILETLILMGEKQKAFELLLSVSEDLSSENWYSTQTTAFSLLAMAKYVAKEKPTGNINCSITVNGKASTAKSTKPVYKQVFTMDEYHQNSISLKNISSELVYYRVITSYIPQYGTETAGNSKIDMKVNYTTLDGTPLDPLKIVQGTDFIAIVQIQPVGQYLPKFENMALSQLFPSGWEIINSRMFETDMGNQSYASYQDIRDDRIYTYFDMYYNSTKTFKVMLNASYSGKFYMPPVQVSAMYDNTIYARTKGDWIEIENSY